MQPSLEKLRKYFRLEHENGYSNNAVIGGLAKMLDYWEAEARNDNLPEEIIQAVATRLRDYACLSPESRADSLKGLWKRIQREFPETEQPHEDQTSDQPGTKTGTTREETPLNQPTCPETDIEKKDESRKPTPSPGRASSAPGGQQTSQTPAALNASLTVLSGIGPRNAQTLGKLGLHTLGDMLYFFPRRYDDYSKLKPIKSLWYGEQITVIGTIKTVHLRPIRGGKAQIVEAILEDGTGALRLTWFNQPWIANHLKTDLAISVSGKVDQYLGRLVMNNPDFESVDVENLHTNRITPVYSLTANITQKWLRKQMNSVVEYWAPRVVDPLPQHIQDSAEVSELGSAILQAHFPDSREQLQAARERLAFDEVFFLQMGVLRQKRDWKSVDARKFEVSDEWLSSRIASLPFELTNAQQQAISDLRSDLASGQAMNRLLQGDVGSGKTVIATLGIAMIAQNGSQSTIMAPTSILAEQHYRNLCQMLTGEENALAPEAIRLIVGDTPEAEKQEIKEKLASGEIKIVIGTHALLEDSVTFADLQLAVIDEQHRFGVEQRGKLRDKGKNLHLLVMTATPIPRSLALTLYGDLDLSVINEIPSCRQPVETYVLRPQERERAYTMIRSQIEEGRQVFIVYSLIEESDKIEAKAAVDDYEILSKEVFPDLKLGLLHGKIPPDEKEVVMAKFRDREYDILVSTTVIEVGVDVPNATVMLIEGAHRFGLAQLHQLRGRVGRGSSKSYCLLIPDSEEATENERLHTMVESNDGFVLAERDMQQRGPGEFLGTRQSGYASGLRMASLTDVDLIEKARLHAKALFDIDPDLQMDENGLLSKALERFWGSNKGDVS
ncbi:MAG: ATP-dependent DNA helicase RecG [Anaerolineales bacterium]|nr:ATP-dependent DNA helicase RecG [Anaerolineales bacterium]